MTFQMKNNKQIHSHKYHQYITIIMKYLPQVVGLKEISYTEKKPSTNRDHLTDQDQILATSYC